MVLRLVGWAAAKLSRRKFSPATSNIVHPAKNRLLKEEIRADELG